MFWRCCRYIQGAYRFDPLLSPDACGGGGAEGLRAVVFEGAVCAGRFAGFERDAALLGETALAVAVSVGILFAGMAVSFMIIAGVQKKYNGGFW